MEMEWSIKLYKGGKEYDRIYVKEAHGCEMGSEIWKECCFLFPVLLKFTISTAIFLLLLKWKKKKKEEKTASLYQLSRSQTTQPRCGISGRKRAHLGVTFADGLHTKHVVDFLKEGCCCGSTGCYLNLGRLGSSYAWLFSFRYVISASAQIFLKEFPDYWNQFSSLCCPPETDVMLLIGYTNIKTWKKIGPVQVASIKEG